MSELMRLLPLLFLAFIPWIMVAITLIDALRYPASAWESSDQDQLLWTIVILSGGLIPIIGPVAYLLVARPRLRALRTSTRPVAATSVPSSVGTDLR